MAPDTNDDPGQRLTSPAEVTAFIQHLQSMVSQSSGDADFLQRPPLQEPRLHPPGERRRYTVRLDLNGASPPIWRRLRLASDITLDRLHQIIQIAMGWTDSHLHHFVAGPGAKSWSVAPFLTDFAEEEGDEGIHEADVRLDQVLAKPDDRLHYEYDFGDSWWHTMVLEKVEDWQEPDPEAFCITGRRACPPEDVGGLGGYEEALQILAGQTEGIDPEWVANILSWMPDGFDPEAFDAEEVNELLAIGPAPSLDSVHPIALEILGKTSPLDRTVFGVISAAAARAEPLSPGDADRAVRRYVALLDAVGDGLALTAAGYLPPRVVTTLFDQLGVSREWIGKGNREDQTWPVLRLRTSAIALGLLRKNKGRLLPTATGRRLREDPEGLWRHIAHRLPLGRAHERDAGAMTLFCIAAGITDRSRWEAIQHLMFGLGWQTQEASPRDVMDWVEPTDAVLDSLANGLHPPSTRFGGSPEALMRIARAVMAHADENQR